MEQSINFKNLAEYYYELGLNVTCINNYVTKYNLKDKNILKTPSHDWESLTNNRQTKNELMSYDWESATGIGCVLGYNNLMALDIDGCVEEDFLLWICDYLKIGHKYQWLVQSGSGAGYHIILRCPDIPSVAEFQKKSLSSYLDFKLDSIDAYYPHLNWSENWPNESFNSEILLPYYENIYSLHLLFDKIEFRWSNHLVLPPSNHRTGLRYIFINDYPVDSPMEVSFDSLRNLMWSICQTESNYSGIGTEYFAAIEDDNKLDEYQWINSIVLKPGYLVFDLETLNEDPLSNKNHDIVTIKKLSWLVVDNLCDYVLTKKGITLTDKESYIYQSDKSLIDLNRAMRHFMNDIEEVEFIFCHDYKNLSDTINENLEKCGISCNNLFDKTSICTMDTLTPKIKNLSTGETKYTHGKEIIDLYKYLFGKYCNIRSSEASVVALNHAIQKYKANNSLEKFIQYCLKNH